MGKKSRRPKSNSNNQPMSESSLPNPNTTTATTPAAADATETETETTTPYPQSDGPSEEELSCLQTNSSSLQKKLNQLSTLAQNNNRSEFVSQFVPLDLSQEDIQHFLKDLTVSPEAQGQWDHLSNEICALAKGKGVKKIEGDQVTNAVFFFEHPTLVGCDREVSFVCTDGEWRAEG
jgi:hypothetical protein